MLATNMRSTQIFFFSVQQICQLQEASVKELCAKHTRTCVFYDPKFINAHGIPQGHTLVAQSLQRKYYNKKNRQGHTGVTLKQHVFALKHRTSKTAVLPASPYDGVNFFVF